MAAIGLEQGGETHALGVQLTNIYGAVLQPGVAVTRGARSLLQEGDRQDYLTSSQDECLLPTRQ